MDQFRDILTHERHPEDDMSRFIHDHAGPALVVVGLQ